MARLTDAEDLPGMLALAQGIAEQRWPHTMDAQVWVKEWLETIADHPRVPTDNDAMLSWFANAIMAGYDTAQSRTGSHWQPISTAPKDGTAILVMRNIWPGAKTGRAEKCNGHNTYVAEWWDTEWVCYMSQPLDPCCPIDPTHWMPLPDPPEERRDA